MTKYVFLLLLMTNMALAAPEVQVSGFGAVSLVLNDSDDIGYRADFSKDGGVFKGDVNLIEESKLGIQVDLIFSSELDAVMQAVYRDQNEINFDSAVNLLFLRYSPNANWSFRVGRTAFDLFLLSEYRDIGYAYPWAHIPAELYGQVPHRFLDGVDMTYRRPIGKQTFSAKLFHGQITSDAVSFNRTQIATANFDNIFGIALNLQSLDWDLAFNHTRMKLDNKDTYLLFEAISTFDTYVPNFNYIWPNTQSFIKEARVDNKPAFYTSVSAKYRLENVTFISELSISSADTYSFQTVKSGYLSAIYHAGTHNYFATFAVSHTHGFNIDSLNINVDALVQIPGGSEVYYETKATLNYFVNNQQTISLGWRWDFADSMSFTLQVDHTKINDNGSSFWQPREQNSPPDLSTGSANVLLANLSFSY